MIFLGNGDDFPPPADDLPSPLEDIPPVPREVRI